MGAKALYEAPHLIHSKHTPEQKQARLIGLTHITDMLYIQLETKLHRFQIPLIVQNVQYHESYNTYQHIIYSGLPWP